MPNFIRFAERAFLILLSLGVIVRLYPAIENRPHLALFLFSELVGVVLILIQRRGDWTTNAFPVAVAFIGTGAGLLVIPRGIPLIPNAASTVVVVAGAAISLLAKFNLGRSFGLVPANRGVKNTGIYRLIRHPMYFGYIINQIGFLLLFFSPWNVAVYVVSWTCLWLRAIEEEKFLMQDEAYRDYSVKVRYRLIPGLI